MTDHARRPDDLEPAGDPSEGAFRPASGVVIAPRRFAIPPRKDAVLSHKGIVKLWALRRRDKVKYGEPERIGNILGRAMELLFDPDSWETHGKGCNDFERDHD